MPKERLAGKRATVEVLPVKLTTTLEIELLIVICAFRIPAARGLNMTVTGHWLSASNAILHLESSTIIKSGDWGPDMTMLEIVTGASPFVIVRVCGWLIVPILCGEKNNAPGLTLMPVLLTFEMYASQFPPGTA